MNKAKNSEVQIMIINELKNKKNNKHLVKFKRNIVEIIKTNQTIKVQTHDCN